MSFFIDEIPPSPPPAVLFEIAAAHERLAELAARGEMVDFSHDTEGRLRIEWCGRRLSPLEVFDVLTGTASSS